MYHVFCTYRNNFLTDVTCVVSAVDTTSQEKPAGNGELSANSVRLRKLPKVDLHHDKTARRRKTITVPENVTEALSDHASTGRRGRVDIQRELSMNLPRSAAAAESELAQAFIKFRRRVSQIGQTTPSNKQSSDAGDVQELVEKPPKPARSNLSTSQKFTSVGLQPDKAEFPQLTPALKSTSSVASGENATQKPSLMKTSQNFQSTDVPLTSDTKRTSVALVGSSSVSGNSTSTPVNATCVKSPREIKVSHSAETEKFSVNSSVLSKSEKEVTKSAQCTTRPDERCTSVSQPRDKPESKSSAKTSKRSMDSERTVTHVPKQEHPSDSVNKKQTSATAVAEAVDPSTSGLVQKSISVVSATTDVDARHPPAGSQLFTRQKSCPGTSDHRVLKLLSRSLDAADSGSVDSPQPMERLRSCASWKTDESGNKLEMKLRKSHSIALKPRKNSAATDTDAAMRSVQSDHKQTSSTVDRSASALQNVSLPRRQVKVSTTESSDKPTGETLVCRSDSRASGLVQHIQSLKAGDVVAEKKLSSASFTGGCCDDMSREPIWLAMAQQKTQRWTEGKV